MRRAAQNERVLRFEFPERPGALFNFLNQLRRALEHLACSTTATTAPTTAASWSACRCRTAELALLTEALDAIGYPYWCASDDPAYRLFLGNCPGKPN